MDAWTRVACMPGEHGYPTDAQWRAMREMSSGDTHAATHYNARSGWVRFWVSRVNGSTDHYSVSPNGHDARWIGTT